MNFSESVLNAKKFALQAHQSQKYGDFPYERHLNDVFEVLNRFGFSIETEEGEQLLTAAWLHDVLEDTSVSLAEIQEVFGEKVAFLVHTVTDEPGETRKERKEKTYPKIKNHPLAVPLKLADRIANVEYSVRAQTHHFLASYHKEQEEFEKHLRQPGQWDLMWRHLESLLE